METLSGKDHLSVLLKVGAWSTMTSPSNLQSFISIQDGFIIGSVKESWSPKPKRTNIMRIQGVVAFGSNEIVDFEKGIP